MKAPPGYEHGAELVYRLVTAWKGERPRFAFPPRHIGLIADLRDVGEKLARNEPARRLVALLVEHCVRETGQAPTAMMLRVVLEVAGIPIEWVPLSELGLDTDKRARCIRCGAPAGEPCDPALHDARGGGRL